MQSSINNTEGSEDQPVSALKYTHTFTHTHVYTDTILYTIKFKYSSNLCLFFSFTRMQMEDYKYISVLGRGHFGKVTVFKLITLNQNNFCLSSIGCWWMFLSRSCWQSLRRQENCTPSKPWRKKTLWLVMKWTGKKSLSAFIWNIIVVSVLRSTTLPCSCPRESEHKLHNQNHEWSTYEMRSVIVRNLGNVGLFKCIWYFQHSQ